MVSGLPSKKTAVRIWIFVVFFRIVVAYQFSF